MHLQRVLLLALSVSLMACNPSTTPGPATGEAAGIAPDGPQTPADMHRSEILQWCTERLARLQKPDGWLSLVGLHWLDPGNHSVGSADDNDVQLATGPAHIGQLLLAEGQVTLIPGPQHGIRVDDEVPSGDTPLRADSSGEASQVSFDGQQAGFTVIERSGRLGLRVKDADAVTRTGFVGIDYFEVDPAWRFDARFEAHPPGKTIPIASVINTLDDMANPGVVIFEKDGQEYRLEAVDEGDGQLFLIFADRTNAKLTYGAGRFLYADPAVDGRTVVDFNRAYNPPCAFNAYSTCPLPPPENRLDLAITAGERRYAGPH
jgi:uncharacterized protein (DUF1684 family)